MEGVPTMTMRSLVFMCMLALVSLCFPTMSVNAQESSISNWTNPGQFPFKGSYDDACQLHADEITSEQCKRAIDQYERKVCEVIYLQDGDIIDVSFSVNGTHKKKTLRVAFGAEYPPNHEIRRASACATARPDGVQMVRPEVCGNWSLMTITPPQPNDPTPNGEIPEEVEYKWIRVCDDKRSVQTVTRSQPKYHPGFVLEWCEGNDMYIAGTTLDWDDTIIGSGNVCTNWKWIQVPKED